jgi:hypothetical protein
MHHTVSALAAFDNLSVPRPPHALATTAIERLIAAVLTHEGVPPHLERDLGQYVVQIGTGSVRQMLERAIGLIAVTPRDTALRATQDVLEYLGRDLRQGRYLIRVHERLGRITSSPAGEPSDASRAAPGGTLPRGEEEHT